MLNEYNTIGNGLSVYYSFYCFIKLILWEGMDKMKRIYIWTGLMFLLFAVFVRVALPTVLTSETAVDSKAMGTDMKDEPRETDTEAAADANSAEKPLIVPTEAADAKTAGEINTSIAETDSTAASEAEKPDSFSSGITVPTREEIVDFVSKIQTAVSMERLDELAALCGYPVYLNNRDGNGQEIVTKTEFMNLNPDQIFTEELKTSVASAEPAALEMAGAGIIVGDEYSIVFNKVEGELMITGIHP